VSELPEGAGWVPRPDPTKLTTDAVSAATEQWRRELASLRELLEARFGANEEHRDRLWEVVHSWQQTLETQMEYRRTALTEAISGLRAIIEQRLDGNDTAIEVAASEIAKIREQSQNAQRLLAEDTAARMAAEREFILGQIANVLAEVRRVESVTMEKFDAVAGTFESNALALAAALAAQKEAAAETNKSNALAIDRANSATKETILANAAQTASSLASQADNIADLKDRVVRIESGGLAMSAAGDRQQEAATFTQTDRIAATATAAAREAATRAAIISVVAVLVAIAAILFAAIHG
jgi:hypothetical protein